MNLPHGCISAREWFVALSPQSYDNFFNRKNRPQCCTQQFCYAPGKLRGGGNKRENWPPSIKKAGKRQANSKVLHTAIASLKFLLLDKHGPYELGMLQTLKCKASLQMSKKGHLPLELELFLTPAVEGMYLYHPKTPLSQESALDPATHREFTHQQPHALPLTPSAWPKYSEAILTT